MCVFLFYLVVVSYAVLVTQCEFIVDIIFQQQHGDHQCFDDNGERGKCPKVQREEEKEEV